MHSHFRSQSVRNLQTGLVVAGLCLGGLCILTESYFALPYGWWSNPAWRASVGMTATSMIASAGFTSLKWRWLSLLCAVPCFWAAAKLVILFSVLILSVGEAGLVGSA